MEQQREPRPGGRSDVPPRAGARARGGAGSTDPAPGRGGAGGTARRVGRGRGGQPARGSAGERVSPSTLRLRKRRLPGGGPASGASPAGPDKRGTADVTEPGATPFT